MLEIAEVGTKVSKEEYAVSLPPLRVDLLNAQFQVSIAETKALSARFATRHNIQYRAIRFSEWAQWTKRASAALRHPCRASVASS